MGRPGLKPSFVRFGMCGLKRAPTPEPVADSRWAPEARSYTGAGSLRHVRPTPAGKRLRDGRPEGVSTYSLQVPSPCHLDRSKTASPSCVMERPRYFGGHDSISGLGGTQSRGLYSLRSVEMTFFLGRSVCGDRLGPKPSPERVLRDAEGYVGIGERCLRVTRARVRAR